MHLPLFILNTPYFFVMSILIWKKKHTFQLLCSELPWLPSQERSKIHHNWKTCNFPWGEQPITARNPEAWPVFSNSHETLKYYQEFLALTNVKHREQQCIEYIIILLTLSGVFWNMRSFTVVIFIWLINQYQSLYHALFWFTITIYKLNIECHVITCHGQLPSLALTPPITRVDLVEIPQRVEGT